MNTISFIHEPFSAYLIMCHKMYFVHYAKLVFHHWGSTIICISFTLSRYVLGRGCTFSFSPPKSVVSALFCTRNTHVHVLNVVRLCKLALMCHVLKIYVFHFSSSLWQPDNMAILYFSSTRI